MLSDCHLLLKVIFIFLYNGCFLHDNLQVDATMALQCPPYRQFDLINNALRQIKEYERNSEDYIPLDPTTSFYANVTCPQLYRTVSETPMNMPSSESLPLNKRTLCPWVYEYNYDSSRFPRMITVARCLCDRCLNSQVEQQENPLPNEIYTCEKTFMSLTVYREVCVDGRAELRWATEHYPVGCVCVSPYVPRLRMH